jgi:serine phosphatase RsbU (regulator of sigma subunit)
LTLPTWDERVEAFCVELGIASAHLVITADGYTDRLVRLRRGKNMSLAAEMQWGILPPLTFGMDGTTVAGLLEPAYDVGGDCFDYSLNGNVLDVAVFDAMGHGLHSAVLGSLAVSAYRNARRESGCADVASLVRVVDTVIAGYADGDSFVTGLFAQLDVTSGHLMWASAGHPAPLHVRRASVLPTVGSAPAGPLGLHALLGVSSVEVVETDLEPGDAILLYTDGVIEARDPDEVQFGEPRLRDLLERESSSGREPAEVLRRLARSVLTYHGTRLSDDASMLYLRWDNAAAHRR